MIFVFSLENEESFKAIYQYYTKMNHYRNISDMPLILVGTQGSISGNVRQQTINLSFFLLQMLSVKAIHVLYMKIEQEN